MDDRSSVRERLGEMFKSTKNGPIEIGKVLPLLSDEDLETILAIFAEYQGVNLLSREEGVWKSNGKKIIE